MCSDAPNIQAAVALPVQCSPRPDRVVATDKVLMAEVFVRRTGCASGEVCAVGMRRFCAGVERAIETVKRVLDVAKR